MGDRVIHFEIASKEPAKLQDFYRDAFDWKINTDNPMGYGMVSSEGEGSIPGGIGGVPDEKYPGHVTFYVEVDDLEAKLVAIEKLGGKRLMGPMDVPGGPSLALFTDPGGNVVGLAKGM